MALKVYVDSDHLPIQTLLGVLTLELVAPRRKNWKGHERGYAAELRKVVVPNLPTQRWAHLHNEPSPRLMEEAVDYIVQVAQ